MGGIDRDSVLGGFQPSLRDSHGFQAMVTLAHSLSMEEPVTSRP
jgi:hypothetical protein